MSTMFPHRYPAKLLAGISLAITVLNPPVALAGGYVPAGGKALTQSTVTSGFSAVPNYSNATLTDKNLVAEANNNLIRTPSTSDPISTVTGNNYHDETDLVIKGRAGLHYVFTRTYNSAPSATKIDLGLGFGWTHSYGMRLKSNDYGNCPNCTTAQDPVNGNNKTSSITYTDERGGDHNYLVNESSFAITPPQGEFDSLAFDTPSSGQHTLTFRNGTKYVFETPTGTLKTTPGVVARLKQIADPWGNQLNFTYNAAGRLSTVTDNLGISGRTGLTFTYDASNHLTQITDWSGRKWAYWIYDGKLAQYSAPGFANGSVSIARTYSYGPNHTLTAIELPETREGGAIVWTSFGYYQNGRAFSNGDSYSRNETLDYDLYRSTTRVTDRRGGVRQYRYDSAGRLLELMEPDGAVLQFQNQADGLRYSKTDGLGYKTQYSYKTDKSFNTASDTSGNVTREQDALGQTIDTTYGPYDQVASVKDKRGTVVSTTFHSGSGTCIAVGKPNAVTVSALSGASNVKLKSYCWNADGSLASQTDYLSPGDTSKTRVTSYTYDAAHLNVLSTTVTGWDGTAVTQSYTYDNLGRKKTETLLRRTSPTNAANLSLTTTYTLDGQDRVIFMQDPAGNTRDTYFDNNGQISTVVDSYRRPDGSFDVRTVSTREYDVNDRLISDTDAQGGITRTTYDEAGNVLTITDPENRTTRFEYDPMNRRTAVIAANGVRTSITYDQAGHPVATTNGAGETTATIYDKIGRATSVADPHGYISTLAYDANNNLTCAIDANAQAIPALRNSDGCTVFTQYDELNRPTLSRDALNGVTQTTFDLFGNPLTRIDAEGRKYTWAYDGLGRLISETDFAGLSTAYALDQAGNVWQTTNRLAEVVKTTFDSLNRPTNLSYAKDGSSETLSYDAAGNLASIANGTVGYTFQYDTLNRLLSKVDSRGRSLAFTRNRAGQVQTKTTYQGSTTFYTYDGAGTLTQLDNPDYLSVGYQYDPAGRLLSRVMSSGARSLYTYDTGGWLESLSHTDAVGTTVTRQNYTRDRVGNITSLAVVAGPIPGTTNYTLDALYRLSKVDAPGTANDEAFSYDHIGNRLTATRGGTTIGAAGSTTKYSIYYPATQTGSPGYTATTNNRLKEIRLGSLGGTIDSSFTFDNAGRLTSQTGSTPRTLTWDAKGRLKTLTQGGSTETYRYDPTNHRIGRSGGSLGNLDYYLEGEHLESVYAGGSLQEKYFRGSTIDELVAGYTTQGGKLTPFFFQHDQVMSVAAETKPNGGTQATLAYFAFGEPQATSGTVISRLQFTGRENDGTGLYQYRARYYDPKFGFISEDPLKFGAGASFYGYVGNNPVNANDPSGLAGNPVTNFVRNSATYLGIQATGAALRSAKERGVAAAWKMEQQLVRAGENGTVRWTEAQRAELLQFGRVKGFQGDHINSANAYPTLAGNSDNIQFLTDAAHTARHSAAGGTQVPVYGALIDRTAGGTLPRLTDSNGFSIKGALLGAGAAVLSGVAEAAEAAGAVMDAVSPWGLLRSEGLGGCDTSGACSDSYNRNYGPSSSSGAAGGGFLLYPNKANTNMMQSVYSK